MDIIIGVGLTTLLAALAAWRSALTVGGLILAWCFGVIISAGGGVWSFAALAATFVFTIVSGKISGSGRERIEKELHAKTGRRDGVQIICNVGVSALMCLIYALSRERAFLLASAAALSASLADSMASELGVMSRRQPRDICSMKTVERGISGGVTVLGLGCSLLGAAIVAAVFTFPTGLGLRVFALITLCGFLAALLDSVLGSALQAKYRCTVCGKLTEKKEHCGCACALTGGFAFMTNDLVNLSNNVFSALLALIIFSYINI